MGLSPDSALPVVSSSMEGQVPSAKEPCQSQDGMTWHSATRSLEDSRELLHEPAPMGGQGSGYRVGTKI